MFFSAADLIFRRCFYALTLVLSFYVIMTNKERLCDKIADLENLVEKT